MSAGCSRREFLRAAGGGAASAALLGAVLEGCGDGLGEDLRGALPAQVACRAPASDFERTLVAIADTVVPGEETDPDGLPGAVEGCVLNLAVDPQLPVGAYAPLLVQLADANAAATYGRAFVDLTLDERTALLAGIEAGLPQLALALRFFRAAHYAGLYNDVGPQSFGYPGGNLGYIADADFSFREPIGRERTKDGNMP